MRTIIASIIMIVMSTAAQAQCAMCRSTLETNFSNGDPGIGAGINTGILYLLILPYLAVMTLGYFWYKSSRNAQQEITTSNP